jgi:prepilin-type N-terminal cleavage/methylation domain-containing protein
MNKKAFTLAEVLITLGIIGVVSAITIPSVIQKYQEKVRVTQLKKSYSMLLNAFQQIIQEQGTTINNFGNTAEERYNLIKELLPKYLPIVKTCRYNRSGCVAYNYSTIFSDDSVVYSGYSGRYDTYTSYKLNNGVGMKLEYSGNCYQKMNLSLTTANPNQNLGTYAMNCGSILVDLNGSKKPNKLGIDAFRFFIVMDGIVPAGTKKDKIIYHSFEGGCLGEYDKKHSDNCTAWVLINENMDYLRCPDKLGWNKARSCKG